MQTSLFKQHSELLNGVLFTSTEQKNNFKILHGFLDNNGWNLIVPQTKINELNWSDIEKATDISNTDKDFAIYVSSDLNTHYSFALISKDYSMVAIDSLTEKELTDKVKVNLRKDEIFEEVTKKNFGSYLDFAKLSFTNRENEELYTNTIFGFGKERDNKQLRSFIIRNKKEIISMCSVVFSKNNNLAYIHNVATNEKYRRKGYFTKLMDSLCNYLLSQKITKVYAIVIQGQPSYSAFDKINFSINDYYYKYAKVS